MSDSPDHWRLLYEHDYISAADLHGRDVRLRIKSVRVEELKMQGGRTKKKPVIAFEKAKLKWVVNKTNAEMIAKHHGTNPAEWVGECVTLYPTTTQFGKETVECVRVRPPGFVSEKAAATEAENPEQDKLAAD